MSYKVEVQTNADTVSWTANALRFLTHQEAEDYADDLFVRWLSVTKTRVVETTDPVTHRYSLKRGLNPVGDPVANGEAA